MIRTRSRSTNPDACYSTCSLYRHRPEGRNASCALHVVVLLGCHVTTLLYTLCSSLAVHTHTHTIPALLSLSLSPRLTTWLRSKGGTCQFPKSPTIHFHHSYSKASVNRFVQPQSKYDVHMACRVGFGVGLLHNQIGLRLLLLLLLLRPTSKPRCTSVVDTHTQTSDGSAGEERAMCSFAWPRPKLTTRVRSAGVRTGRQPALTKHSTE